MNIALVIVVIIAALLAVASGIWVAVALVRAIFQTQTNQSGREHDQNKSNPQ